MLPLFSLPSTTSLTAALSSAKRGFTKLKDLKVPFTRPTDYFAEMIKSDAHMEKVRQSLVSEKKRIEEAEERRKQRELKKFGKKVQTEKLLERAKEKRCDCGKNEKGCT